MQTGDGDDGDRSRESDRGKFSLQGKEREWRKKTHNNPCFPCNIAITNFLILYMCEVRFYDVIDLTVHTFTS